MAGILHGQAAVDELEKQLGRKPTAIETQIAMEEGYSKKTYRDTNNVLTSGWGQTGNNMGVPLDKVAAKYESRTQKLIPAYNTLPDFVKNRAFDATYRGTLGQSPMTVDLMNAGQYGDAADEFLNNQEYRDAVLSGSGVAKRMERTADAFRVYGNQDTKQVVPQMATSNNTSVYQPTIDWWKKVQQEDKLRQQKKNPVPMHGGQTDPRGVPIMTPEESLMQQSVVPSMPSNEGHWLQSNSRMAVAEAKKQAVLEAQSDPRNRTTNRSSLAPATIPALSKANTIDNMQAMQAATQKIYEDRAAPVDPRGDKLIGEMGIVPPDKLSDADMRQLQYTTQQSDLKAKRASDSAQDKVEYEAYAKELEAQGVAPKSFDRWKTEKTWAANNAQIADDKAKKLADKMSSAQSSYDIFIAEGGNSDDITLEDWSKYDTKRRIMEMGKVDKAAAKAAGGTSSLKDPNRVNAVITPVPPITANSTDKGPQPDSDVVKQLEVLKAEDAKFKEDGRQGPIPGNRKQPVIPEVEETLEQFTKRIGKEFDDQQTGSPDKSSYSSDGSLKDGEGNEVAQTKEEKERNKGIFDKASELFGDIFTAADLKRMVLYTVGGMITGGSIEGSFQWAAGKIMEENGIDKQNQLVKDAADDADASRIKAAALASKERKEAAEVAATGREKAAFISASVAERAADIRIKAATKTAAQLAGYNLDKEAVKWKTKPPVQVKVPGKNIPVQARWNPNGYYVSARDNETILNAGRNVVTWDSGVYGKNAQRSSHIASIEGIRTSYENKGDEPDLLGDRAANIYDKYLIKVDEWADEYGYTVDLSTALSRQVLSIAAQQSVDANRGKTKGFITPEHFFDTALLKGFVSSIGGSQKIFDAKDGKPIDSAANEALIGHIKKMQQYGAKQELNSTIASVLGDVHSAWDKLEDSEKEIYNNSVRDGNSGFAKFALEIKIPKP